MIVQEGKLSLWCFLSALTSTTIFALPYFGCHELYMKVEGYLWLFLLVYFSLLASLIRLLLLDNFYEVGIRAFFLGALFSCGLGLSLTLSNQYSLFGWYLCVVAFFHWSEFITIAMTNPSTLTIGSYILDHSTEYKVAHVACWVEFWLEAWLLPDLKMHPVISMIGLALCIGGELMRKLAMFTAMENFNHVVQNKKQEGHKLVTHGVYGLCRHPSYVGWFYWAIGTQLILCNPFCAVTYMLASWKFFYDRITIEEITLLNFFENDYIRYQKKVPTGLPFIRGYLINDL